MKIKSKSKRYNNKNIIIFNKKQTFNEGDVFSIIDNNSNLLFLEIIEKVGNQLTIKEIDTDYLKSTKIELII